MGNSPFHLLLWSWNFSVCFIHCSLWYFNKTSWSALTVRVIYIIYVKLFTYQSDLTKVVSLKKNSWFDLLNKPRLILERLQGSGLFTNVRNWWASLVAQTVKNLPAMHETRLQSLGQEDPLEKEMATHSSILAWRSLWIEEPGRHEVAESRIGLNN